MKNKNNEKNIRLSFKESFKIYRRSLGLMDAADKGDLRYRLIRMVFHTLHGYVSAFLSAYIIDSVSKGAKWDSLLLTAGLICLVKFILAFSIHFFPLRGNCHNYQKQMNLKKVVCEKVMDMDYTAVENPDTHLSLRNTLRQLFHSGTGLAAVQNKTEDLVYGFSYIIIGFIFIFPLAFTPPVVTSGIIGFCQSFWGLLAVIFAVAALEIFKSAVVTKDIALAFEKIMQDKDYTMAKRLEQFYLTFIMDNYRNGKDIRIFSQKELILREFDKCQREVGNSWIKYFKRVSVTHLGVHMITALSAILMYGLAVVRAATGMYTVGELTAFVAYFSNIQMGINFLSNSISLLKITPVFCKQVFDFLDIPDEKYKGTIPTEKRDDNEYEFQFKDVWFKYPGSDQYALKGVNLKWRIGEKMALVGRNGSGKSTLVKLLCRLYDPTKGEITLNGIDIRKYNYKEYMDLFSVVFQDSKMFSFSIGENVAASVDYDRKLAEQCVRRAGLSERLDSMPDGIDTCIYKSFDENGIEISGGEAQKLTLARAIYKGAPFIILDEPTASLDPISENEIYTKFNSIVGTRTAIYISHRLSSCKFCDDITVLEDGKIAERGNHEELLAANGIYGEMWTAQAEYYS